MVEDRRSATIFTAAINIGLAGKAGHMTTRSVQSIDQLLYFRQHGPYVSSKTHTNAKKDRDMQTEGQSIYTEKLKDRVNA